MLSHESSGAFQSRWGSWVAFKNKLLFGGFFCPSPGVPLVLVSFLTWLGTLHQELPAQEQWQVLARWREMAVAWLDAVGALATAWFMVCD